MLSINLQLYYDLTELNSLYLEEPRIYSEAYGMNTDSLPSE